MEIDLGIATAIDGGEASSSDLAIRLRLKLFIDAQPRPG